MHPTLPSVPQTQFSSEPLPQQIYSSCRMTLTSVENCSSVRTAQ